MAIAHDVARTDLDDEERIQHTLGLDRLRQITQAIEHRLVVCVSDGDCLKLGQKLGWSGSILGDKPRQSSVRHDLARLVVKPELGNRKRDNLAKCVSSRRRLGKKQVDVVLAEEIALGK